MLNPNTKATGGKLVYSTDGGRHCQQCAKTLQNCQCNEQRPLGDGNVRVRRENKGRGGKTVSVVSGLPLTANELKKVGVELKKRCGCGGAVKGDVIEIQGDKVEMIVAWLVEQGYQAKRSGG